MFNRKPETNLHLEEVDTETRDVKAVEPGSIAAELQMKGVMEWVMSFAYKNPKNEKNSDKKSKKEDDFDPKKFFNENKDKTGYAVLALIALALYFGEDIREGFGLYKTITFQELGDLINQNLVKRIKVQKIVDDRDFRFQAIIYTNDGKFIIQIGNVDSFTESIEKI